MSKPKSNMKIVPRKTDELIQAEYNPRMMTEQQAADIYDHRERRRYMSKWVNEPANRIDGVTKHQPGVKHPGSDAFGKRARKSKMRAKAAKKARRKNR